LGGPRLPSLIGRRDFVTKEWIQTLEYSDAVEDALIRKFGPDYRNKKDKARSSKSSSTKSGGKRSSYVSQSRTTANPSEDEERPSTSRNGNNKGNNNLQLYYESNPSSLMKPDDFKFGEKENNSQFQVVEVELVAVRSDTFSTQGAAGDAITITDNDEEDVTSTNLQVHVNSNKRSTPTRGQLHISTYLLRTLLSQTVKMEMEESFNE